MNLRAINVCLFVLMAGLAQGQIAGIKQPAAGSSAEGKIVIAAGSDAGSEIPITIIRGAKAGPLVSIIAGLSGTDYAPMNALRQFAAGLNPTVLSGTVVLVHIANLAAFLDRSIALNPVDHKDLTRVFPGKRDGTLTERTANAITTEVLDKSDAVIVLQAGAANTMLAPHVIQAVTSDAPLNARIASMAMAFGINYIVSERNTSKTSIEGVVLARSKPVLKVMCGSYGSADGRSIDVINKGLLSTLNLLDMIKDNGIKTRIPVLMDNPVSVESPHTGLLFINAQRGQNIHKGEGIFAVSGYHGKASQIVVSPVEGIVLSIVSSPPVNKGEVVAVIATPREQ